MVCGAGSRLSARVAIDLPDWLRLSGVSPLPRGASSHALGVAVSALPWFAACAGVLCVSARMCVPERASSARGCGTHPPVARRVLIAVCLAFFGLLCLTWCVLWCPLPPPRCAQIAAPSRAGPFRAPAVAAASPRMGMMPAPIFRYGRVHVHICMYISMYVSETFFIYVHVVDVSISICVRVGPQDACLLRPKKHGAASRLSARVAIDLPDWLRLSLLQHPLVL